MAEVLKPVDINKIWSASGDILAPSDTKISQGWAVEIPPRQYFNYIDNKQDRGIAHINQHGIAVWDNVTEYQAGKSYTQGSDGNIYKALQTNTNQNPISTLGYWSKYVTSGSLIGVTTITSSSTFTPNVATKAIRVKVQGPGGAGGASAATGAAGFSLGGGGGSGGYVESYLTIFTSTVSCIVNSTTTSFGSYATAGVGTTGSSGIAVTNGNSVVQSGGGGGSFSGGNILSILGSSGQIGAGSQASNFCAGNGADSRFGSGGRGTVSSQANGSNASGYGAGGGGGGSGINGAATSGGAGGPGIIIIEEYS